MLLSGVKKRISLVYAGSCYEHLYLKINFTDIWLVIAYTVTYRNPIYYIRCCRSTYTYRLTDSTILQLCTHMACWHAMQALLVSIELSL